MVGSNGTFAYINLFSSPSLASESATALSRISEVGIDGYGRLEIYLSLNGNRISTCYFLWEDFLDCCSPPRARRDRTAREKGGHGGGAVEGFTPSSSGGAKFGVAAYSFWIEFHGASIHYRWIVRFSQCDSVPSIGFPQIS